MTFTTRHAITGTRLGPVFTDQTEAEQAAAVESRTRKHTIDIFRHSGEFDTFGTLIAFAADGAIINEGI